MDMNEYKLKNHYEYEMNQCQHASKGMNEIFFLKIFFMDLLIEKYKIK